MAEFAYRGRSLVGELVTGKLHGGSADAVAGRLVNIGWIDGCEAKRMRAIMRRCGSSWIEWQSSTRHSEADRVKAHTSLGSIDVCFDP
jgi:hypothetical protein